MVNLNDLENTLKTERDKLLEELINLPPFRPGTVTTRFRRCGKAGCACRQKDHPGHGPQVILTYKEGGKTKTINLASANAIEIIRRQIEARNLFQQWQQKWIGLNKKTCNHQLEVVLQSGDGSERKKKF